MTAPIVTGDHINNLIFVLNQLRAGANAMRFGHHMSALDLVQYYGARQICEKILELPPVANDDELIGGMEQHIATLKGEQHAQP